ncbi:MAG TPA: hypothetical protein VK528_01005 [Flavobacterium sp.]|nr:hypothetical protein [Flavobacterium sp.]
MVIVISTVVSLTSMVVTVSISTVTVSFFEGIEMVLIAGLSNISGDFTAISSTRP